uniref:Coiled-coil domain containing 88A n=1 Tax=Iconisemion striatum TaxID=60296 RepID=A0A1A7WTG5_9TELE
MIPLPDVLLLGNAPCCEQSLDEMKKLLLLLLGCAVQCEKKETYIERIQTLDFETKAAIAAHIQELTHNQENVLDLQWLESNEMHPEEMEVVLRNMAALLRLLLDQRDAHLETIAELMQEKEGVVTLLSSPGSFSPSMQQQHLGVELADSRAKIRRLRQELEEKKQLHKMEFYKAKVEELKEDNRLLQETKEVLEDQLEGCRTRTDKIHQLEKHSLLLKAQIHDLEQEKEADTRRIKELQEENLNKQVKRLEVKYRALDSVNQQLQASLYNTERKVQRLEAEIQELEAENQVLQASLEELRISAKRLEQLETEKQHLEHESTTLERDKRQLEKENRRLRQQVEIQEANLDSRNASVASLDREMRSLLKELEALRETSERVKGLERDKRELSKQAAIDQKTLATLREELVSEKLKTQQRDDELEELSHQLEMKLLNQQETPDNRFRMLESELESSLKNSLRIKDDKVASLEARLLESSSLNQQLRHELKTVKLSNEAHSNLQMKGSVFSFCHDCVVSRVTKQTLTFCLDLNGVQSRAQSQSSGEFSVSLENEPWSNGSSPVQQPQSCSSSFYHPPSDASTPQRHANLQQQKEKASDVPTPSIQNPDVRSVQKQRDPVLSQDFWLTRGTKTIRRGSRAKMARRSSDSGGVGKINSELNGINTKDSTAHASACSPVTVLYVQGKSSSMSGCLNCFSTPLVKEGPLKEFRSPKSLPRASSVISTAEGSSRRSSVSSDCRVTVKSEPLQVSEESQKQDSSSRNSGPEAIPPVKPPRDPAVVVLTQHHKSPVQESLLGSSFTFNSVFSNTIFSDSEVTTATSLDGIHMGQNFSPLEKTSQTLTGCETDPKQNTEQSAELDRKSQLLTAP